MQIGMGVGLSNTSIGGAATNMLPPAAAEQTLHLSMDGTLGAGSRTGGIAWNPETGVVAPHNQFLNAAIGVTQNITVSAVPQFLAFKGTGTITLSGVSTAGPLVGTGASNSVVLSFTPTAGTLTLTVTGSCTEVQLNAYSLTPHVPTTTAAVYLPRYVSGKSGQAVLVEEASTNLLLQSNAFTTTWSASNVAAPAMNVLGPFGAADGWTLRATASNAFHTLQQANAGGSATTETSSIYVKAGTTPFVYINRLGVSAAQNYVCQVFDLSDGTLGESKVGSTSGTKTAATISPVGNGWYRISLTGLVTEAVLGNRFVQVGIAQAKTGNTFDGYGEITFNAAGTETLNIYQAQIEALPYATSPIVTGAAPVTRLADVITHPTAGALTAAQGTISLWVKVDTAMFGSYRALVDHESASTKDIIRLYIEPTGKAYGVMSSNAGVAGGALLGNSILTAGWHHLAHTHSSAEEALWVDGVKQTAVNTLPASVPSVLGVTFRIGNNQFSTGQADMPIDALRIWNRPLTAAEVLQAFRAGR